jgi:hypothetical protein
MKNLSKNPYTVFIPIGLFVIAMAQITSHYMDYPDFAIGVFNGIGIGLMIWSFLGKKLHPAH